jgi:hypothetical protein
MSGSPMSAVPTLEHESREVVQMSTAKLPDAKAPPNRAVADLINKIEEVAAFVKQRAGDTPSEKPSIAPESIEARLRQLEASKAHLERDIAQLRSQTRDHGDQLARLQGSAIHLPSKAVALSVIAVLGALIAAAAFAQQIEAILNITLLPGV